MPSWLMYTKNALQRKKVMNENTSRDCHKANYKNKLSTSQNSGGLLLIGHQLFKESDHGLFPKLETSYDSHRWTFKGTSPESLRDTAMSSVMLVP